MRTIEERPIIFTGPMVRAILSGAKTNTRRVITPQPVVDDHRPYGWAEDSVQWHAGAPLRRIGHDCGYIHTNASAAKRIMEKCSPYGREGDRLWVRETFARSDFGKGGFMYRADGDLKVIGWTPAIHMPREACRLMLTVSDVRVERLQEIDERDVRAEGCEIRAFWVFGLDDAARRQVAANVYRQLWDSINGKKKGLAWADNPWVWSVHFSKV